MLNQSVNLQQQHPVLKLVFVVNDMNVLPTTAIDKCVIEKKSWCIEELPNRPPSQRCWNDFWIKKFGKLESNSKIETTSKSDNPINGRLVR